jgi:uncharacterized lipoprotein YbaY
VPTSVAGTLAYRERVALSDAATATVAIVQVQAGTLTIVGSMQIENPGQIPIAFDVPLDANTFDPTLDTELWATITDGDNAWATGEGVAVATNGAPSQGVVVELTFRPDLLEGHVTGFINGTGDTTENGYFMTWVISDAGDVLGVENQSSGTGEPIPFAVPFRVTDVDPEMGYVARAYVKDESNVWVTQEGAAVITGGNPFADVELTVAQVAPTPSPSPTASPSATAVPTPPASGGIDPLVIALVAGLVIIGVVAVVMFMRRE